MGSWHWSVSGIADTDGTLVRPLNASGTVDAERGEEALHKLLGEIPGPWDELDSDQEFTVTLSPT